MDLGPILVRHSHWVALVLLIAGFLFHLQNLDSRITEEDEGSYLYAAWRISEGDVPYREFLTPQLPVFLYTGAALMEIVGPSEKWFHLITIALTMLGAGCLYLAARRFFSPAAGLVAMTAFLFYPDVYKVAWMYRPDPYMLFFTVAGLCLFIWADRWGRGRRWGLAAAGLIFGLSVLTKLFGALPLAACAAFVAYRGLCDKEGTIQIRWRNLVLDLLALTVPAGLVVCLVMGAFYLITPEVYVAVLGHHLMQGGGLSQEAIFKKGLYLFWQFLYAYAPALVLTLPLAVWTLWKDRGRRSLFAWYFVVALVFLFLSREVWLRHLVYLAPAVCILLGYALGPALIRHRQALLLIGVVLALLIPWMQYDVALSRLWEVDDWRLADYIAGHTAPDDYVVSDHSELNFYALRKSTYSGASLSGGAASSGQITGQRLIEEIEADDVRMIVLSTSGDAHHQFFPDRDQFLAYLETNFRYQGSFRRHSFPYHIYVAPDLPPRLTGVSFGRMFELLSTDLDANGFPAGTAAEVRLRFQAQQDLDDDYKAFVYLKDGQGHIWAQADDWLVNSAQKRTSGWMADEINVDRFQVRIPADAPPGEYEFSAGLYRETDMSRLNLLDATGNTAGTEYRIGKIDVTRPARRPSVKSLEIPYPLAAELGDTVRLLGWSGLGQERAQAGETLALSLYWEALEDLSTDYALRLELAAAEGQAVASQLFPPAGEAFPTSQWQKGDRVQGRYEALVDATLPAGRYQLQLNWVEATTGEPLAGEAVPLGTVQVSELERQFEVPPISHPLRAELGQQITLLGYDLETPRVQPGQAVHLTLYWQAMGRVGTSYTVFTHLLGDQEQIRGQWDSIPASGERPTTGWLPGEVIVDEYAIPVDADAPLGSYLLEVGMYDALTGVRLPVVIDGVPVPGDRILLDTVEVTNEPVPAGQ
jgi:4-amino-4-deoxy-L-arabinose transferase-like glycosyltransferase